jgi:hypothetical protein
MKTEKNFDCNEMKWKIQDEIAKEFENISDEESYKIQMTRISNNPLLKRFVDLQKKGNSPNHILYNAIG